MDVRGGTKGLRLLVRLNPKSNSIYDNDYHYRLQGLVYSMIREGGMEDVHDQLGYKFFCFSNIFPYREKFQPGREQDLLISSPDRNIISAISSALQVRLKAKLPFQVGRTEFALLGIEGPFSMNINNSKIVTLISSTPIIIRIPKWRYDDYGITSERPFENWRDNLPLEAFVKQLRDNMEKKVRDYFGTVESSTHESWPEVISYRYLRSVSKPITVKGESQQAIGSMWALEFSLQNQEAALRLEFAFDAGFGERNSMGFGFMNKQRMGLGK